MRTLNLNFFAEDAMSKNEMNYLKGGMSIEKGGDLIIPPMK